MKSSRKYLACVMSGVIITLVSGLYTQDLSKGAGATITGYGLPLTWLEKTVIVVPGSPTSYSLSWYGLGLLADIACWSVLMVVVYLLYDRLK